MFINDNAISEKERCIYDEKMTIKYAMHHLQNNLKLSLLYSRGRQMQVFLRSLAHANISGNMNEQTLGM